jgi:hypothetical protein
VVKEIVLSLYTLKVLVMPSMLLNRNKKQTNGIKYLGLSGPNSSPSEYFSSLLSGVKYLSKDTLKYYLSPFLGICTLLFIFLTIFTFTPLHY